MKRIFIFIFVVFPILCKCQSAPELLESAYKNNSKNELYSFFDKWNHDIPSVSDSELLRMNDTLRQTYSAFAAFLGFVSDSSRYQLGQFLAINTAVKIQFTKKIFYNAKDSEDYAVNGINALKDKSQRELYLRRKNGRLSPIVMDNFSPEVKPEMFYDSVDNFRPRIYNSGKQPLYLTSQSIRWIADFVETMNLELDKGDVINIRAVSSNGSDKLEFLLKEIDISFFSPKKFVYAFPIAPEIIFDRQMLYAKIEYSGRYSGSEAILERRNGKWRVISVQRTWVE